jgi:hypothetical protein
MATVEIKPHLGQGRNESNELVDDIDTGIDAVYLVSAEWPQPLRVGFVGRDLGSPVNMIVRVSDSELAAIGAAVSERTGFADVKINHVPAFEEPEEPKTKKRWGKK